MNFLVSVLDLSYTWNGLFECFAKQLTGIYDLMKSWLNFQG